MELRVDNATGGDRMTGVQDPDIYAEARAMFGDAGAAGWLRTFGRDLARHLAVIGHGCPEAGVLRDIAHKTGGRAGLLGFCALAEASWHLEEAVRHNGDVAAALDHWMQAARPALEVAQGAGDAAPG